ncbi:C6 domain-containing protein [Caenorhabditis elegans]|uniref:C6 domain-containing protein n=1 Tax=Caenorhabditis elegans TaxID=6239 RepID=A0A4V0IJ83_CAEEL|nr:C6 domain-containing protein [Caenorhabditis elegans]VTW47553.1 C6 domain-containing protein [Caenorhabditis elegans]
MNSSLFFTFNVLSLILMQQTVVATGKQCMDIITIRNNENDTITPKIFYYEGAGQQIAEISCAGETSGVVELISNDRSLGVIEDRSHKAICRLGRWYSLNKYGGLTVVKEVACLVHL